LPTKLAAYVAVVAVAWSRPDVAISQRPVVEGFTLDEALATARSRLQTCNPPADKPAPGIRFCSPANPLVLQFLGDSLSQIDFHFQLDTPAVDATAHWRRQVNTFQKMMGAPPDSIEVKPAKENTVLRWPDPRGDSAKVVRARWRATEVRRWCAAVTLTDQMDGPAQPVTFVYVDVHTAFPTSGAVCSWPGFR
jgi:hypothetical protein